MRRENVKNRTGLKAKYTAENSSFFENHEKQRSAANSNPYKTKTT
jgi:hypothetical protein